jgi:hypothetical protein
MTDNLSWIVHLQGIFSSCRTWTNTTWVIWVMWVSNLNHLIPTFSTNNIDNSMWIWILPIVHRLDLLSVFSKDLIKNDTILGYLKKKYNQDKLHDSFNKCSVRIYNPPVANNYLGKCLTDHSLSILKCTEKGTCTHKHWRKKGIQDIQDTTNLRIYQKLRWSGSQNPKVLEFPLPSPCSWACGVRPSQTYSSSSAFWQFSFPCIYDPKD